MTSYESTSAPSHSVLVVSHACIRVQNREIYRVLLRRGIKIELLVPESMMIGGQRDTPDPPLQSDPPIHTLKMSGRNARLYRYEGFAGLLEKISPDVILLESDPASLLTLDTVRWRRKKPASLCCLTNENLSWHWLNAIRRAGLGELPNSIGKSLLCSMNRQFVDHVFTTSEEAAGIFRAAGFATVSVVPLGTDRNTFRYSSAVRRSTRARLGIGADERIISYFGRLVPEKDVMTLIEALAHLQDAQWRLMLNHFISSSAYSEQVTQFIAAKNISDRVIPLESRHGEIADAMCASDVVVLPSKPTKKWVEQFGRVVPEAMSCGNVAVVSDSGAPKELIGPSGFVFKAGDANHLAAVLRQLILDPSECKKRRRLAIRRVRDKLSTDVQADLMLAVIEQLAAQRQPISNRWQ